MMVLGLTGGVGMGKSACAQFCRARGIPVVDTDEVARQVVEPGQAALDEIRRVFGAEFIGPDGRLCRGALARRVFADVTARRKLEAILHPRIRSLWRAEVQAWRAAGVPLGVVVIPLLFETGAEAELDATICLGCSVETQHQRLRARGWLQEEIAQRAAAQWPIEKKLSAAQYVIWTEGSLAVHEAQLERILTSVKRSGGLLTQAAGPQTQGEEAR